MSESLIVEVESVIILGTPAVISDLFAETQLLSALILLKLISVLLFRCDVWSVK